MSGNTFKWLGGHGGSADPNDIGVVGNWLIEQDGSFVAATSVPAAGDTMLVDSGTISDSGVNFVGNTVELLGSGVALAATGLTFDAASILSVGTGDAASLLVSGNVLNSGTLTAATAGARLFVKLAGTLTNAGTMIADAGGTLTVSDLGGAIDNTGTVQADGGSLAITLASIMTNSGLLAASESGTLSVAGVLGNAGTVQASGGSVSLSQIDGAGLLMVTDGGTIGVGTMTGGTLLAQGGTAVVDAATGAAIIEIGSGGTVTASADASVPVFFLGAGTLVTTAAIDGAIYGFDADDAIDLPDVAFATLGPITVDGDVVTVGGTVLDLAGAGIGAAGFSTAPDATGGTLLTAPGAQAANWSDAATGDWGDAANWGGTAPGTQDQALIVTQGTTAFTVSATNDSAFSVALQAVGGTLAIAGTFSAADGIADLAGAIAVAAGATLSTGNLTLSSAAALSLAAGADVSLTGSLTVGSSLSLQNGGSISGFTTATVDGDLVLNGASLSGTEIHVTTPALDGTLTLENGANLSLTGLAFVDGEVAVANSTITVAGLAYNNGNTAALSLANSNVASSGDLDVGTLSLDTTSSLSIGSLSAAPVDTVQVAAGHALTLTSLSTLPTLDVNGSAIFINGADVGALAGSGNIDVGVQSPFSYFAVPTYGSLEVDSAAASTTDINLFGTLTLLHAVAYTGTIETTIQSISTGYDRHGFPISYSAESAVFDLRDVSFADADAVWDRTTGIASLGTLAPFTVDTTNLGAPAWGIADDGSGGTLVTFSDGVPPDSTPCYCAGTRIATPAGAVPVEALRPGDLVLAWAENAWVPRPVRWVGRMTVDLDRHPAPATSAPIRILAHAFAPNVPHRDLRVSPDHAVLIGDVLMQAQALVNGATIVREAAVGRVSYFHVELERHALLLAEGLPAESYLDTGNRGWFAAEAGVRPLFPVLAHSYVAHPGACLPLLLEGAEVAAGHAWLLRRARALGHRLTADPALLVLADGVALALRDAGDLHWRATLPPGTRDMRLVSRASVPDHLDRGANDRRRLGIAVASLRVGGRSLPVRAFTAGWHAPEPGWRWTDGDARLVLRPSRRALTLRVRAAAASLGYWYDTDCARRTVSRNDCVALRRRRRKPTRDG